MSKQRIIIDCDPGHDDFAAIALATQSDRFAIDAITTVTGNAPVSKTSVNALSIAAALDLECDVFSGAEAPLLHRYDFPTEFHGESGMDSCGANLPAHSRILGEGHAALEIIRRVRASPEELIIVLMGPMTNLALALSLDPGISKDIRKVVFMGGSLSGGNVTSQAEFNIWADPEAAHIVLSSGLDISMFGLDVTDVAWLAPEDIAMIKGASPDVNPLADILQFYTERSVDIATGRVPGPAMHDTCPIAWLIDPTLFRMTRLPVSVGTIPGPFYGATHSDRRTRTNQVDFQVDVAVEVDRTRFAAVLTENLCAAAKKIGGKSVPVPMKQIRRRLK